MNERDGIARSMRGDYLAWLEYTDQPNDLRSAKAYVHANLGGPAYQMADNIAEALCNEDH